MKVKLVKLNKEAIFPKNFAHESDAGFDFVSPVDFVVYPESSIVIKTGIGWEVLNDNNDKKLYMKMESKSGLSTKYSIRVCGGVIDEGNRGDISVQLHNIGTEDAIQFKRGEKIAQGIVHEIPHVDLIFSDKFNNKNTTRGDGGFGSTGK